MEGRVNGRDRQQDRMEGWSDGRKDGWQDGEMAGWMDGRMEMAPEWRDRLPSQKAACKWSHFARLKFNYI